MASYTHWEKSDDISICLKLVYFSFYTKARITKKLTLGLVKKGLSDIWKI